MISLWDMLIASRFPADIKYFCIGVVVFSISLTLSLCIMPLVIHSIWVIVKPVGRKRGIFGAAEHDYNHYRITICIFIAVLVLQVIATILCIHGLFFLSNIGLYRDYLVNLKENTVEFSGYIVPSTHHVLYFLEAAFEAARENLLLWGFLFLVNYICKLVVKRFYFKSFTVLLLIRVLFIFACSYRIPELIASYLNNEENKFVGVAESISPFHTLSKSLRTLEIFVNLVICLYFIYYLWLEIRIRIKILEQRPDNQVPSPYDTLINTLCDRTEMLRIKKYSILYLCLLLAEFILNLIQCQFPNFIYKSIKSSVTNSITMEMVLAIVTDILSYITPLLTILFILVLIRTMTKSKRNQDNPMNYDSLENSDFEDNNLMPAARLKLYLKALIVNGSIIVVVAFVITAFTSYLWYSPGNRVHLVLRPGDFVHLDNSESQLYYFIQNCDSVKAQQNVDIQFTHFDINFVKYKTEITPGKCEFYNKSVLFYENITKPEFIRKDMNITFDNYDLILDQDYWYPNGTYFDNFNINMRIGFSGYYLPFPCYPAQYLLSGFQATCGNYSDTQSKDKIFCDINTVSNNNCSIPQTGVFALHELPTVVFTFSIHRPMHMPQEGVTIYSYNNITRNIKDMKLIQFLDVDLKDSNDYCHIYLVCHYAVWKIALVVIGTFSALVVYLSVMLVLFSVCKLKWFDCFQHKVEE